MRTLFNLYTEYVLELDPILWSMGQVNGVHVDNEARLKLLTEMNGIIKAKIQDAQPFVSNDLRPRKRFVRRPEGEATVVEVPGMIKTCSRCGKQHVTKGDHTARKMGNPCYGASIILTPGVNLNYDVLLPFNPGSDDQLKAYAEKYHHRLGRNWKTGEATLDAKELQKFIDKHGADHPIYEYAREIRKVRKARGYAKAWIPDEDGLIYGQFKHVPETFRLSQAEHNFMNVSHRGNAPYAHELRRLIIAPPGYSIVEADSSSIEAVFSGKLMGSESYMKMAKGGVHAAWALSKLGLEVNPGNIKKAKSPGDFKEFWAERGYPDTTVLDILYETKKRTVHGVTYGMGAKLLHESYPEYFPVTMVEDPRTHRMKRCPLCSAQAEIDDFYSFVPDLQAWHKETQDWAFKHAYLQSPWGFRNYYYSVYTWDSKEQRYKMGPDAKAVIAFQPQHANAMFQRENLKLIHSTIKKMGKQNKWFMTAIGHVHDSNGLRVPDDDILKAGTMMAEIMNRPIKQFEGLQIGVAVKAGKNWDSMKGVLSV